MPRQEWAGIELMGGVFLLTFLFIGLGRVVGFPDGTVVLRPGNKDSSPAPAPERSYRKPD
jgi:hypothetical protein